MSAPSRPRSHFLACPHLGGHHRMHYLEWGEADNPKVIVCVHGLTRNAHDFDALARVLARTYRVICPDVVGRGESEWLPAGLAATTYGYPQYLSDMLHLIRQLNVMRLDWLGTSMGGLIGLLLASAPAPSIKRLLINDVGPFLPYAGLMQIAQNIQGPRQWPDLASATAYYRARYAPFGAMSDEEWTAFTVHSTRVTDAGWVARDDPAIAAAFKNLTGDVDIWASYDKITCPTLVIRGAASLLLTQTVWQAMATRGPRAQLVEFAHAGHAPALVAPAQIETLVSYLRGDYRGVAVLPTV